MDLLPSPDSVFFQRAQELEWWLASKNAFLALNFWENFLQETQCLPWPSFSGTWLTCQKACVTRQSNCLMKISPAYFFLEIRGNFCSLPHAVQSFPRVGRLPVSSEIRECVARQLFLYFELLISFLYPQRGTGSAICVPWRLGDFQRLSYLKLRILKCSKKIAH